jgi:quercetin dioxygenase-like cupin family protein
VLVLKGRLRSFYYKQVAQEAVANVEGAISVANEIAVEGNMQKPAVPCPACRQQRQAVDIDGEAFSSHARSTRHMMGPAVTTPGEIVGVPPHALATGMSARSTLLKTRDLEVVWLAVASAHGVPTHELQGEIIVHCLRGHVRLEAQEATIELRTGDLVYYEAHEPFSIHGVESSALLVTIARFNSGRPSQLIG